MRNSLLSATAGSAARADEANARTLAPISRNLLSISCLSKTDIVIFRGYVSRVEGWYTPKIDQSCAKGVVVELLDRLHVLAAKPSLSLLTSKSP
jgi:hypothetical protein